VEPVLPPAPSAKTPEEKFAEYLSLRGKRFSRAQRQLVCYIFSYHEHFTANKLLRDIEERGLHISRATVYRTLALLVDAGLLQTHRFNDELAYEHAYGYPEHDHLYCKKCGAIIEFRAPELLELRERVARAHQFRAETHRFVVCGICEKCSRTQARPRKLDLV
jgi:Fur family ferric uptake transcriptional regulator